MARQVSGQPRTWKVLSHGQPKIDWKCVGQLIKLLVEKAVDVLRCYRYLQFPYFTSNCVFTSSFTYIMYIYVYSRIIFTYSWTTFIQRVKKWVKQLGTPNVHVFPCQLFYANLRITSLTCKMQVDDNIKAL